MGNAMLLPPSGLARNGLRCRRAAAPPYGGGSDVKCLFAFAAAGFGPHAHWSAAVPDRRLCSALAAGRPRPVATPTGLGIRRLWRSPNNRLLIASAAGIRPGATLGQAKLRTIRDYSAPSRRFWESGSGPMAGSAARFAEFAAVGCWRRHYFRRPGEWASRWNRRSRGRESFGAPLRVGMRPAAGRMHWMPVPEAGAAAPGRRGSRKSSGRGVPGRGQPPPRLATPQTPSSRTRAAPKLPTIDRFWAAAESEATPSWRYQIPAASKPASGP